MNWSAVGTIVTVVGILVTIWGRESIAAGWRRLRHRVGRGVELYETREALDQSGRRSLKRELKGTATYALGVFPTGTALLTLGDDELKKFDSIILSSPLRDDRQIREYVQRFEAGSSEHVRQVLYNNTRRALGLGVKVYWHPDVNISMVLGDPVRESAWARIELLLPNTEAALRPSIVIHKRSHDFLFRHLLNVFDRMKDASIRVLPQMIP